MRGDSAKGTRQTHAIIIAAVFILMRPTAEGGICFQTGQSGVCRKEHQISSGSQDDCCRDKRNFFVNRNLTYREKFMYFLNKTVDQCLPCGPPPPPEVCDGVQCPQGKVCKIQSGKATCVCFRQCKGQPVNRVCGTDGQTYHNECVLTKRVCVKRMVNLKVAYDGVCRDNCKNVTCREAGQTCVTDQYKKSHCISCDSVCSNAAEVAVCGTDGITYKDECDLRRKACRARKNTSIAYYQPCLQHASCSTITCPSNMQCIEDDSGQPRCVDCNCSRSSISIPLHDVCGTDNVTYTGHCQLLAASCASNRIIGIKHIGKCYVHRQLPSDQPDPHLLTRDRRDISVQQLLQILKDLGVHVSAAVPEQQKVLDVEKLVKKIENAQYSG